jgi:hypothetical protein
MGWPCVNPSRDLQLQIFSNSGCSGGTTGTAPILWSSYTGSASVSCDNCVTTPGTYYWRIRACQSASECIVSECRSIVYCVATNPSPPTLLSPADDTELQSFGVLSWQANDWGIACVTTARVFYFEYRLQGSSTWLQSPANPIPSSTTSAQLSALLTGGSVDGTYQWRVSAQNTPSGNLPLTHHSRYSGPLVKQKIYPLHERSSNRTKWP